MRLYAGLFFFVCLLPAQSLEHHRFSLSGGWGEQMTVYPAYRQTAPVLGLSYGYRPLKWVELETGLSVALQPGQDVCNAHGCFNPNDRYIWIPFGLRLVAPIPWERVELSVGGGGLYGKYSVSNTDNPFSIRSRGGWGGYFTGGAAVKLSHHVWLGATPRFYLTNPPFARDRWFVITGDVTFRF